MNYTMRNIVTLSALVGLCSFSYGATGEVTQSGSTWTGKVDGVTKYTGSDAGDANNACMNAMSSGTVFIRTSTGTFDGAWTKSNCTVDGTGRTFSGGGTNGVLYAANSSNIGGRNMWQASTNWYGIFFRTCNGQNVSGTGGTAGKTFRIDNCKGGTGYNLTLGSPTDSGASGSRSSDNIETYGISGGSAGTITSIDREGCGTLLNKSSNFTISSNNATRCDWNGGYAGFRTANTNGKTTVGTVTSTSCGRGYFSVSGSRDCTISTIQTYYNSSSEVWLQSTYNTRINSGTLRGGCWSVTGGSGNVVTVTCQ
ncbi:MAG: hypothetical protein QM760_15810 [Nibricoccus sp.]